MRSITRTATLVTDRDLKFLQELTYKNMLNMRELVGKTVLDAGSGESAFAIELRNKGVNAFSIDMEKDEKYTSPNGEIHTIGLIDKMPFAKEVFDFVFSSWSLFYYLEHPKLQINGLKEIYRVLKPEGKLITSPVEVPLIEKRLKKSGLPMQITQLKYIDENGSCVEITKMKKKNFSFKSIFSL